MELNNSNYQPLSSICYETVTNTAISSTQPLFGNHTLESLSDLTVNQLLDLNTYDEFEGPQPGDIYVRQLGDNLFGLVYITRINDNGVHEIIYMRRVDNDRVTLTPQQLNLYTMRSVDTTSMWSFDDNDTQYTAEMIEGMEASERYQFED